MMSLLTIEDLEIALGRTLETEEEPQVQYLIDAVSAYIENYTSLSFSLNEDVTVRMRADYYGIIQLAPGPIGSVATVANVGNSLPTVWYYDGIDSIYNLYPNQVVDVTYTYGYTAVPNDIKFVATEMVKSVVDNFPEGSLRSKQIGDVQYAFAEATAKSFGGLGADILDSYAGGAYTIRTGPRNFPTYNSPYLYGGWYW